MTRFYDVEQSRYRDDQALDLDQFLRIDFENYAEPILLPPDGSAARKRWERCVRIAKYHRARRHQKKALSCLDDVLTRWKIDGSDLPDFVSIEAVSRICKTSLSKIEVKHPTHRKKGCKEVN